MLQAVLTACGSFLSDPDMSGLKVNIVTDHDELVRRVDLIKVDDFPHGCPAQIHKCQRFCDNDLLCSDPPASQERMELASGKRDPVVLDDPVDDIEAHIVAGAFIAGARISQADKDVHVFPPYALPVDRADSENRAQET